MKLKELRAELGLTQKELAAQMNTTQQTIARWETGKTLLNIDQIRDLCDVLDCTAVELLGWEPEEDEAKESPFTPSDQELPFGALQLNLTCGDREYPIGFEARKALLSQMVAFSPINSGNNASWIQTWSLNNKLLLINPTYLRRFRLISDESEAMPSFENPEVYRALEAWPEVVATDMVKHKCVEFAEELGSDEAVFRVITDVGVTYYDGSNEWCALTDEAATALYAAVMNWNTIGQHSLLELVDDGGNEAVFANLGWVALIEIPTERYLRLISPEND